MNIKIRALQRYRYFWGDWNQSQRTDKTVVQVTHSIINILKKKVGLLNFWKGGGCSGVVLKIHPNIDGEMCTTKWVVFPSVLWSLIVPLLLLLLCFWPLEFESFFYCGVVGFKTLAVLDRGSFLKCGLMEFQPRAGTFSIIFSFYYSSYPNACMFPGMYVWRTWP